MKKLKMFSMAAALLLVTAGVFAGKFTTVTSIWAYNATHTTPFEVVNGSSITLDALGTGSGTQASITGADGTYGLYYEPTSGTYDKLVAVGF
jgi:hypothetical protein